jgi:hypothetical protein
MIAVAVTIAEAIAVAVTVAVAVVVAATVRSGRLRASASVTVGERISWRFEGGREGCGETTAVVGVSGALLGCKLHETWARAGVEGEWAVEEEVVAVAVAVEVALAVA